MVANKVIGSVPSVIQAGKETIIPSYECFCQTLSSSSQADLLTSLYKVWTRMSLNPLVLGTKNLNWKPWNIPWRKKSYKKRNRSSAHSKRVWHPVFPCFQPWRSFYKRTDLLCSMEGRIFFGRKQYHGIHKKDS